MNSLVKHYDSMAVNFDKFWIYSEEFVLNIVKDIEKSLDFQNDDTFVDIGSGTGIYTTRIIERSKFKFFTICVDISEEMLKQIPNKESILKLKKSASDFSKSGVKFDKGLLKEVLHHIDNKKEVINKLCENLNEKGIILFIISPVLVEYPLFRKALELRQNTKSSEPMIVDLMRRQGLKVTVSTHSYPVNLSTDRFIDMVKGRYLSFLSKFSDNELERGIREMQSKFVGSTVSFVENYIFIKGVKVHSL